MSTRPDTPLADELREARAAMLRRGLRRAVFSAPKTPGLRRLTLTRLGDAYQAETLTDTQAFHKTLSAGQLPDFAAEALLRDFTQLHLWNDTHEHQLRITKKGRLLQSRRAAAPPPERAQHDRAKNHLLPEGEVVPPLVDMGVFTREGRVVASMRDKYRQINRFLELVEDALRTLPQGRPLRILDFGCGKSYLTFVLYDYFAVRQGRPLQMVGLDLKADVIARCNEAARRYGYTGLTFEVGDINGYETKDPIDMVVTLHACDTATDFALYNALRWQVPVILSVPCCQHEVNGQIEAQQLGILTRHGILKERFSALLTDAIRANLLTCCGYRTQVLEFIDLAHTPKNLLLRARRGGVSAAAKRQAWAEIEAALAEFSVEPTLLRLLREGGLLSLPGSGEGEAD